jgi:Domain of unknown function (DUF5642)
MVLNRRLCPRTTALLTLFTTILALAGCSTSTTERESSTAAFGTSTTRSESATTDSAPTASSSAIALPDVDLSRLADLRDDFPAGFNAAPPSEPGKESAEYAYLVGDTVSYGRPFTVNPPQCRALLKPVDGLPGADRMGVGAEGPEKQVITVSLNNPVTVPAGLPSAGCDRMSFHVQDDAVRTDGTAERLAAPNIHGAATSAIKITVDGAPYVEYFYVAILDSRAYTEVRARVNPNFQAQPLLPDLLSKAVAAIRE